MASTHGIDIRDNVLLFHRKVIVPGLINLTPQLRNYGVNDDFNRVKKISGGNKSFHHFIQIDSYDNNQYTSYFNEDSLTRSNLMAEGISYWSMQKTGWFADKREPGYGKNASASEIFNVFKGHRNNMLVKFYEFNDRARWINPTGPNDGSAGQVQVLGIPHYIVTSATAAVGQNGGHPSGYSTVNGLSRTTNPELKNWTATATDMSINDGQKKLDDMIDMMQWHVPVSLEGEEKPGLDYIIESHRDPYTMYRDQKYAFIGDADYSKDPAKVRNAGVQVGNGLLFRGIQWNWVDALTQSTLRDGTANPAYASNKPVYLRDRSTWIIYAQEGFFMQESEPVLKANDHNVVINHMDTIYQRVCFNPGANGVITFG